MEKVLIVGANGTTGKQIVMKRFRARAKGRAAPIMKPYSNLTIN